MTSRAAALPTTALVFALQFGCPGDPSITDDDVADDDAGDDDSLDPLDLESAPELDDSGLGPALAWAGVLEAGSDLLVGGAAGASRPGDYMVVNNMGRFVVRGDRQGSGYVGVPGALIDIDCRRGEGNADADALVELVTLLGEGRVFVATSYEVATEGLEPGVSAQLKLHGTDRPLDLLTASLEDPGAYPPLGLEVHQSLTLAPGSPAMWLETTVVNTTDQHLDLPLSDLMFVDASVAAPFVPGIGFGGEGATGERDIVAYQSHDSEQAIGLFWRDDSVRVDHLPGVHDAIGHVVAEGPTLSLAPGEYDSYRRVVAAVRDVGTMDFYRKLTGETWPVTLEGWVRYEGEDKRIWHARVFLQDPDGTPRLMARTESLGGYYIATDEGDWRVEVVADLDNEWVDLPPGIGAFGARANEADNEQALWAWTDPEAVLIQPVADGHHRPDDASITLEPGRTWLEFTLERPATLAVRVEDGDGQPLPAVVQVRFPPGVSDPHPPRPELGERRPGNRLRKVLFLVDGEAEVPVPSGTYDLLAHRGLQYEIDRSEDVVLAAGETTSVTLTLGLSLLLVDPGLGTWNELMSHQQTASGGDVVYFHDQLPPGSLLWFVSYPVFAAMSYPLPLLVTALPGLARILGRRHRGRALPVWIFIWCSLLILTFMAVRMGRYVLPLFPALCLLSAWWGSELQPHRWRRPVLAALAALFLMVLVWEHGAIPGQGGWIGDGVQRNFAVMNDTTMPTEEDMARLREGLIPNLHCELDLFLREISEISLQEGGTNPLAMGGRGLGKLRLALPEAVFMGYIVLQAKQRITNRFVYELDPDSGKRQILGPMTFLLMHPAGLDLRQEGITGKLLISRYQPIHCQARTTPFRLSLIKTTTALSAGKR